MKTPPMSPRTPNRSPARGFFFDLSSPMTEDSKSDPERNSANTSNGSPPMANNKSNERSSPGLEWWEANSICADPGKIKSTNLAVKTAGKTNVRRPPQFDLNPPEHLPSSPLCPKNPTHPTRGFGICVYHGRRRSVRLKRLRRVDTEDSGLGTGGSGGSY